MSDTPTLYVCHGDEGGPRMHPCRRVQEALRDANIDYDKVVAALYAKGPFKTVLGNEQFDDKGDIKLPGYKVYVWHQGKYDYLTP